MDKSRDIREAAKKELSHDPLHGLEVTGWPR